LCDTDIFGLAVLGTVSVLMQCHKTITNMELRTQKFTFYVVLTSCLIASLVSCWSCSPLLAAFCSFIQFYMGTNSDLWHKLSC